MFVAGDLVRLRYGHTPLQVVAVYPDGRVRAKYCHKYPVTHEEFAKPMCALNCQTRNHAEFVYWTGYKPIGMNQSKYNERHRTQARIRREDGEKEGKPLVSQFIPKRVRGHQTHIIGTLRGYAGNGDLILEFGDGRIESFPEVAVRPYIDRIIHVTATRSSYSCYYRVPDNAKLAVDDLLMSDSGNIYRVLMTDVKREVTVKGPFRGKKIITTDI